ncbi:MAG: lysophospholipid acyltransferase family protein [Deltaproteobacteria bacterium]|nr:lysophospholipid acyltransferase family protein [Deltaproteobacteria bacterium]
MAGRRADLLLRLAPPLGRAYLRLAVGTSRCAQEGREVAEAARVDGGPLLWCFWHNRLLGPAVAYRGRGAGVVISRSGDGELVNRLVEGLGYVGLRGSTSRGGASALRSVLRHLRAGRDVAFTPDGPKGPRYAVQPGVAYVAVRTGLPVIPVGVGMTRKAVFPSWDRFQVPLPFGRILIACGAPLVFASSDDVAEVAEVLRAALVEVTERADRLAGTTSP